MDQSRMTAENRYLIFLLTTILTFNYLDRVALGVMLQSIKTDLSLSDTQLGVMTGIAFALFYAVMGIPIARWADRGNRVTIISLTTALWSISVAACGFARSFTQLLLARVAVAVGEAGCYPPALSLISDRFARSERPRAVANYMLGIPMSFIIGNLMAGWLSQFFGWRATFLTISAPGIAFAFLCQLTLSDPRSQACKSKMEALPSSHQDSELSLVQTLRALWTNDTFRHLWFCFSVWGFFGYGIQQWQPAFFVRSHGLEIGPLGTWLALTNGIGGLLGTWIGGELASRYAVNNERFQLLAISALYSLLSLVCAAVYLMANYHLAFIMVAISAFGGALANGPLFAAIQTLVPHNMRAMATAIIYFFCNLIGLGLGPLTVGMLSDTLRAAFGEESLRYALLACCPGYFWCSWHLWKASKTVVRDLVNAERQSRPVVVG